jgi:glycine oxidase
VRVIDPKGVGAGASGGIVGALAPHVPEQWNAKKQFQLDSLLMAESWWQSVARMAQDDPGYIRSGRVQPLGDEAAVALARQREGTAQELWGDAAEWRVTSRPAADFMPASPTGLIVHDTLSALVHPRRAVTCLAKALAASGVAFESEAADEGAVVWATGWEGLEDMTRAHNRMVGAGVKGQAALLDYKSAGAPQLFVDGLHIVPHRDGTVAVGSTTEREFDDPTVTDAQCDALVARACAAVPALVGAKVITRWAGVRPRSRSRAPMLGRHPFRDGFVANGGFKIGFGMAPKVGEIMAALVLEGRDDIPPDFGVAGNL